MRMCAILPLILLACPPVLAAEPGADDAWFEALDAENDTSRVNTGVLTFLPDPPDKAVHHHINRITISGGSLADGWIALDQCHRQLDPVPRAEITFHPERIRHLEVVSSAGIERAWAEAHTIQLADVRPGATLCLRAESRALHADGNGGFVLRNGPYMRRFLDGYYPMHVTLTVLLPERLRLTTASPQPQPGFSVAAKQNRVELDAWFEGRLETELHFVLTP